jgi:hypothetical protein
MEASIEKLQILAVRALTRIPGFRRLWRRVTLGPVPIRNRFGIWDRPHYANGVFAAAQLAQALGMSRITAIEFGVAGGNGLISLERIAEKIGRHFNIAIDVVGFDTGSGMPPPLDYRDVPSMWQESMFKMNVAALRDRLTHAKVIIGNVNDTVNSFVKEEALKASPIGFIAFDLDYYSSTKAALSIFDGETETHLPRVCCYFDDIYSPETACPYVGELLAIAEFNDEHASKKICRFEPLHTDVFEHPLAVNRVSYIAHHFAHPLYTARATVTPDLRLH